jgi:small-conductance mechanosensitive channel
MRSIAEAEEELRILRGQGYYTEADIARMRELEQQIQEQRDTLAQQEAAWEREDQRIALQRERDQAVERLEQQHELQQQALEDQIAAEEARLEAQYEAAERRLDVRRQELDREREMMQRHFEELQRQAQQAYQAEINAAVAKYQQLMQAVIDQQNALLGEQSDYYNAGYTLGQQFAQGILASIPLIEQAGLAAAEAVSRYLELHSPAKAGPLAELDRWWRAFVPTLVRPLDTFQAGQAASAVAAGVRQVARAEEVIRIEFAGDATGLDIRTLADIVEDRLKRKIDVRRGGLGRQHD